MVLAIQSYVVYMGSPSGGGGDLEAVQADHLQMLSSVVPSGEQGRAALTQSYHHAFEGFAAALTEKEAASLSGEAPHPYPFPIESFLLSRSISFFSPKKTLLVELFPSSQ
jgi:hypothetical protein